jgi:serine/threonine-protein kinase
MGFVDRLRIGRHLRTLRAGESVPAETLAEAKAALRELGPAALPQLFDLLGDTKAQRHAREVLESLLSDDMLPAYVDRLGSVDRVVQSAVVEILKAGRRYHPERLLEFLASSDAPRAHLEVVLLARAEELDADRMLESLPDYEREARTILFRVIEELCDESIAGRAAALTQHTDWWIRAHMAKLLARIPGAESEAALAAALGDRNKSVRLGAVHALAKLEARGTVPTLVKVLKDGDLTVQAAAIDALISIGDPAAVPHLVDILKDESEQARRGAVEVLNAVATPEAIQDLVHALRDADWWVRVRAADALGTIGGNRVVDAILGLMDDTDVQIRRYAVEILNTIPDDRSVESLLRALDDEDWWVRERSIDALGRTKDARAVQPLARLMTQDANVAPLAARALGELGQAEAVEPLLTMLSCATADELVRETVDALVKIAREGVPSEMHVRVENALREHGVRLEKTRVRPMEIRAGAAAHGRDSGSVLSLELESPLERKTHGPAPELAQTSSSPPPDASRTSPEPAPAAFLPEEITDGTILLGRYKVLRKIGRGGFSTVFLVEDQAISDRVILKILSSHLTVDESMARRFVQELKLARRISHRNVIRIHDLLQVGRSRAISMEYFESEDLGNILDREEVLTATRGLALARQICAGLAAAHEAGVIHRDVKPANILVGAEDLVKIVDFGLASVGREVENRLTRTGHLVGTPHYMAPELIRGEPIGIKADIYSFGVMMYEMFSGKLPYDGENAMNILFRHLDGDAAALTDVVPSFPSALGEVVMRAMHLDPSRRPATAAELLVELEQAVP